MSFSFGNKPAFGTPTFGAPQPNLSFGNTAAQPAQPQPNLFGTPTVQPGGGLSFGAAPTTAPATGLFGATPAPGGFTNPQVGLNFGAPAGAVPNFGTPASAVPNFGTPASAAPNFAAPATTAAGSFSFGNNAPNANLSFGAQPVASKPGLSFNVPAPTASHGLIFSTPATTAPGFSLGATPAPSLGLNFGPTTTSAIPTLNFATPASQPTGLNFAPPTSAPGVAFAGFGTPSTSAPVSIGLAVPVGLGGVATSTPTSSAVATKAEQAPKEQHLPNEIQQTVESFKNFVKQQKSYSSDVARCSIKEFRKVESDIDAVNNLLNEVEKQLQMNKNVAEKLKYDTAKGLQLVEMAQRTYDTPLGLQYENNAPMMFFLELADTFERELQNMKLQIENTDKYVKNIGKPTPLSSQDLAVGMRRIHETFVALAGRLQSVHTQVEAQKEQYLNIRKHRFNDATNIFENQTKGSDVINLALNSIHFEPPKIATGPTPFNSVSHPSVVQAVAQSTPPPPYGANNTFGGFPPTFGGPLFGNTSFGQPFGTSAAQSGFLLQKPPTGNKRGKQ